MFKMMFNWTLSTWLAVLLRPGVFKWWSMGRSGPPRMCEIRESKMACQNTEMANNFSNTCKIF